MPRRRARARRRGIRAASVSEDGAVRSTLPMTATAGACPQMLESEADIAGTVEALLTLTEPEEQ